MMSDELSNPNILLVISHLNTDYRVIHPQTTPPSRSQEEVSTLIFWERIFKEKQTTALFQKLRRFLSLLLQLLFLTLLIFALTRPQLAAFTKRARQLIVVMDNSASMNAVDVEPSRLDAAKTQTLQFIYQMSILDEMMIVSCNNHPIVHSPFTNHRKSLKQAVERITATDISTDLNPALELAYSVAQTKEHPAIIIFSDFQNIPKGRKGKRAEGQSKVQLHFVKLGDSSDNVGITKFQVRRSMINAFDYQTLLTVSNMSDEDKTVNVELYNNDVLFDVRPFALAAGQSKSEIYASFNVQGGQLKAVLDVNDNLATDNLAYAVLPERKRLSVLLVTPGNLFLEKVLQVNESLDVSIVSPTEYANASKRYDAVILDNFCPATIDQAISPNYMLIYPPAEESPWQTGEELDAPIVTEWNRTHPILNYVNLQNVQLSAGYKINPPPEAQVLARSFEDALIIAESKPHLKLVFIAFDIDKSDLPLRIAFPVIMANSFSWFQSETSIQQRHLRTYQERQQFLAALADIDEIRD